MRSHCNLDLNAAHLLHRSVFFQYYPPSTLISTEFTVWQIAFATWSCTKVNFLCRGISWKLKMMKGRSLCMQINMVFVLIPWQTLVFPAEPLPCYQQWHHCPISRICSCFQLQNSGVPKWHYGNVQQYMLSIKDKECVLGGSHKHAEDC